MISKSFLKSSFIFTLGGALPMVASIILLPFYTDYLNAADYTKLIFYISISAISQILFSFCTEQYFGVKYSRLQNETETQKEFIGTVSVLLLFIGLGLTVLSFFFGKTIFNAISREDLVIEFWPYGFFSILTGFFNSYFKVANICLIYTKQPTLFLWGNTINLVSTVAISLGGLYYFPDTIIGPIYGRLFSGLIIFFIGQYVFLKYGTFTFNRTFLRELREFCTPYLFYAICAWVLSGSDRYILLEFNIEIKDLNAYDALLKCFFGIEFLQNSLTAVIFPRLYEIWGKNKEHATTLETNRYFNVYTAINVLQLILFCIFIPIIYKLFIKNESFYSSEPYIGILASGYALRSILSFYLSTVLFTKKITVTLKVFFISTLFQLLVTVLLAKYLGLIGVVFSAMATATVQVLLYRFFTKSIFKYNFNKFKIIGIPFIYILVNIIQYVFFRDYSLVLYLLQLIIFGTLFYFIFKNEIKKLLLSFNVLPKS